MKLSQMHSWFRQYAQQMGMQNVRAILPEQIDTLINTATEDIIDEVIGKNINQQNDRIVTDNIRLGNLNSLKTMYRNYTMKVADNDSLSVYNDGKKSYNFSSDDLPNYRYIVDFSIRYFNNPPYNFAHEINVDINNVNINNDEINNDEINNALNNIKATKHVGDYVLNNSSMTDEGITAPRDIYKITNINGNLYTLKEQDNDPYNYFNNNAGPKQFIIGTNLYTLVNYSTDNLNWVITNYNFNYTRWFPVRIIDDVYLSDTLNDYVLAPRIRSPILVTYGSTILNNGIFVDNENQSFDIYFGETSIESIIDDLHIAEIKCSYIKSPRKVKYLSDVSNVQNIESDLPEQLQIPMLKHAVDLYRLSIQGSMFANQQNAQNQQQEIARNVQRPDNEGYQS